MKTIVSITECNDMHPQMMMHVINMSSMYSHYGWHWIPGCDIKVYMISLTNYVSTSYNRIKNYILIPFKNRINRVGMLNLMVRKYVSM